MPDHVRRLRDCYAGVAGAPFYRAEFGYYCREAWVAQGLPLDADPAAEFGLDPRASFSLWGTGWCEPAFEPEFEVAVLEDRGEQEVVRDKAGRHVLYFKNRRDGFMPEYLAHAVHDRRSWEEDVRPRLDPATPSRWRDTAATLAEARAAAAEGQLIVQRITGGYMYLRALIGPEDLPYTFYDDPGLIESCMEAWLALADAVCARHQQELVFDEIFFGEDICYNHGPLISPAMIERFLFPYYQELIDRVRRRQADGRRLYVHLDTDGFADPVIDLYRRAIGMDRISPCEVAAGTDVVALGERYPDLILSGGIDKRILAAGRDAIETELQRILPVMRSRGGYYPTCDHGVPAEVPLADYRYYRQRCLELGG